ncbi:hypothetical protein EXU57_12035 [Segetibacter sp. 3557_3]|uniref:hypothetical protein n=1 Tax=Segetibacter sp. 3557_3 TaxID=2547429 RepID=UPI0010584D86|nr:hypothetical protein [Segetibacter sp. 3557_3]TDH26212.1 hypothetical protein EXU57_12035 [Segetibacter sp. 3557_3]
MEKGSEMSGQQSLLIIQQMIETAKQEQKDDGKAWIIWGWMLFFASLTTILNQHFRWGGTFLFWNIFGIVSLLLAFISIGKRLFVKRQHKVKTYTRDLFNKLNIGFFISLMFIIAGINLGISPMIGFPLLMNLYAFWVLIYGAVLNFKPSYVGAIITWILAFGCLFVHRFELLMVFHGTAVLFGYIIPGHIANREFRKLQSRPPNQV